MQEIHGAAQACRLPLSHDESDRRFICGGEGASLIDLGDGVACLVLHGKMNTIDRGVMRLIQRSIDQVRDKFAALVIGTEAKHFSAGASLSMFLETIRAERWDVINEMEVEFQDLMNQLKFAPFPTAACPAGMTLGGGCEITLATTLRVAYHETFTGLVEAGVGLMPAGGGTKDLALRAYKLASYGEDADALPFLQRAFQVTCFGRISKSAQDAIDMGLYPPETTLISLNKDELIPRAKRALLALVADGYTPKRPLSAVKVAGVEGLQAFREKLAGLVELGEISPYDSFIGERIATVLCGGAVAAGTMVAEAQFTELERGFFVELSQQPQTAARMEHMLKERTRLRN